MNFDPYTEFDVLNVLAHSNDALRLSDVFKRASELREKRRLSPPAISTVSLELKALDERGLVKVVTMDDPNSGLRPPARSPRAGYKLENLAAALADYFKCIGALYPEARRSDAILDFARAIELSPDELNQSAEELHKLAAETEAGQ